MKSNTASNRDQNIMGTPDRVNAAWGLTLVVYSLAKLWLVADVELGKDEAVYWYWGQHLDASYALLPFSLMASAHALAPYSEWVLRFPSVLLGALSTYLLFALSTGRLCFEPLDLAYQLVSTPRRLSRHLLATRPHCSTARVWARQNA